MNIEVREDDISAIFSQLSKCEMAISMTHKMPIFFPRDKDRLGELLFVVQQSGVDFDVICKHLLELLMERREYLNDLADRLT